MDIYTACENYCDSKDIRPDTIRNYRGTVRIFAKNTKITDLQQITPAVLAEWKRNVAKRSSATTFNYYHRHLSALFRFCVREKLMSENPLANVKIFPRTASRGKTADLMEIKKICRYLQTQASPSAQVLLLMIQVLYYTGMRRAQICGLCWSDMDFKNGTILLRKEFSKNAREWRIAMDSRLEDPLRNLKTVTMSRLRKKYSDTRQVFCMQLFDSRYAGDRFTPDQFTAAIRRVAARSGSRLSPHMIRHLVATTLVNHDRQGAADDFVPASLVSVQYLLGHESINTTTLYVDPNITTQKRLLKGLDDLL